MSSTLDLGGSHLSPSKFLYWFEVLDGLLENHWRNVGLAFNCTFLLFGSVLQLIAYDVVVLMNNE
ncbi:BnaAnng28110D [Brassica napus]|uniref:BnaAnng28110D protein n=1 Tax=Brassica napus TaxID=3708 RepID=A0A078JPJ0_BRANA|nr:BnaAnng28110D [Brassica napus]